MAIAWPVNLGALGNSLAIWLGISPWQLFFYVFLPPLLLDAAVRIDWYLFKKVGVARCTLMGQGMGQQSFQTQYPAFITAGCSRCSDWYLLKMVGVGRGCTGLYAASRAEDMCGPCWCDWGTDSLLNLPSDHCDISAWWQKVVRAGGRGSLMDLGVCSSACGGYSRAVPWWRSIPGASARKQLLCVP
jgi:hypothetical protein